jgi:hypothetical protein
MALVSYCLRSNIGWIWFGLVKHCLHIYFVGSASDVGFCSLSAMFSLPTPLVPPGSGLVIHTCWKFVLLLYI